MYNGFNGFARNMHSVSKGQINKVKFLTSFNDHYIDVLMRYRHACHMQLVSIGFYLEAMGGVLKIPHAVHGHVDPRRRVLLYLAYLLLFALVCGQFARSVGLLVSSVDLSIQTSS